MKVLRLKHVCIYPCLLTNELRWKIQDILHSFHFYLNIYMAIIFWLTFFGWHSFSHHSDADGFNSITQMLHRSKFTFHSLQSVKFHALGPGDYYIFFWFSQIWLNSIRIQSFTMSCCYINLLNLLTLLIWYCETIFAIMYKENAAQKWNLM